MAVSEKRKKYLRDWCKRNPERRFMRYLRARLKGRYGMTPAQYGAMLNAQGFKCYLCRCPLVVPTATNRVIRNGACAVIDHIHAHSVDKLRQVRGILCNNCNRALGLFKESPEVLRRAADYVELRREVPFVIPWQEAQEILRAESA